ncbi:hypothetical protein QE152_g26259 [Popillia japonica]|uniref:Uncharacterized protein n=1 Tax=Popillia japonica TaxID=7064 RepID=A0AAW1JZA3_POPJA
MFKSMWIFIQYWYMRYLLVTELYMVEKWERVMIHFVFFMIFCVISLLNASVVLHSVRILNIRGLLIIKIYYNVFIYTIN